MDKRPSQKRTMNGHGDGEAKRPKVDAPESSLSRQKAIELGLPQRWKYCPPMGKVVADLFLPMKSPLGAVYDELIAERKYRFHPTAVFQQQTARLKEGTKIGLWIDFTNTTRYYSRREVEQGGCTYRKMALTGHGQSPTAEESAEFIACVKEFAARHPKEVIAMHCTHGFNRTGFLIVAYLVEERQYSLEMALEEFRKCRPDGIYKDDYLSDLRDRYGDSEEQISPPARPHWEAGPITDEEFYFGGPTITQERPASSRDHDGPGGSSDKQLPKFMDGLVAGVSYVENDEERQHFQEKTRKYLSYTGKVFPGSQPVSLEESPANNNIQLLAQQRYMVSWKADGVRYLVLIAGEDQLYAFDRDNNVFRISGITFLDDKLERHRENTLVDAEMIIEKVEGAVIPRMLIYDIMRLEGEDVGKLNFPARFDLIERQLIAPRTEALRAGKILREREPISIRRKSFWDLEQTHKLLRDSFRSNFGHDIDGLIFQPCYIPYTPGRCDKLLKWKPPEQSTVDFKLIIKRVARTGELPEHIGYLFVLHQETYFAMIRPATKVHKPFDNKIVECKYNQTTGQWEILRERTDKSHPNALSTAISVCNTIRYPVSEQALIDFIAQRGYRGRQQLQQ